MATSVERVPAPAATRKGRFWGDPDIRETLRAERAMKTAAARNFLARMGRDDYLDAHHSCLERMDD